MPAASSEAELIRLPDDNLSIAVDRARELLSNIRLAVKDDLLVFTTTDISDTS
jgi:hypothetical protein